MIKKLYQLTDINGGFPPFLSVINTDFIFPQYASDGAYLQEINGERTVLFSLRGVTATVCGLSDNADTAELTAFLNLQGIENVISDFFFDEIPFEEKAVLRAEPSDEAVCDAIRLSTSSRLYDYQNIFNLLSGKGSFEKWYPLFCAKVNKASACGVYLTADAIPVSCAVAPFVFENSAVVAGVFTNEEYRKKGYATKCVKALLSELKKINIENAYLWCEDKNIKFYEKIGFSLYGKIYVKEE